MGRHSGLNPLDLRLLACDPQARVVVDLYPVMLSAPGHKSLQASASPAAARWGIFLWVRAAGKPVRQVANPRYIVFRATTGFTPSVEPAIAGTVVVHGAN